jgi:hypothetical protein
MINEIAYCINFQSHKSNSFKVLVKNMTPKLRNLKRIWETDTTKESPRKKIDTVSSENPSLQKDPDMDTSEELFDYTFNGLCYDMGYHSWLEWSNWEVTQNMDLVKFVLTGISKAAPHLNWVKATPGSKEY